MQKIQPVIDLLLQSLREKASAKILICVHEGGIRDLSIDKKVKLGAVKT